MFGGQSRRGTLRDDDVSLDTDQVGCQGGESLSPSVRRSVFESDGLAFYITLLSQPLPECVKERMLRRGQHRENSYAGDLSRLLRFGAERRRESADEPCQEGSPAHDTSTERAGGTPGLYGVRRRASSSVANHVLCDSLEVVGGRSL